MAWLSGYNYRKSITLSRASGAVSNYQMKLLLGESSGATGEDVDCGGKCLSTFNDLRFTTSDGTTLLDYWIESISGTTPNQLATVWIEFDSIGTSDTTFYMYYGNSGASAVSNGTNTFEFFDLFNDDSNTLDTTNRWTVNAGSPSVSGDKLIVGNSASDRLITKATWGVNYAMRARVKVLGTTDYSMFGFSGHAGTWEPSAMWMSYQDRYYTSQTSGTGNSKTLDYNYYHNHDFKRNGATSVIYSYDDTSDVTVTTNLPTGSLPVGFTVDNGSDLYCLWVLIRKYQAPEPTWGSWGAEEYDVSFTTESAVASATMDGITPIESTTESAEATDTFDGYSLRDSFTESAEASDTFGSEKTAYGVTTESAEAEDTMAYLHMVDSFTDSAVASDSMEAAEMIRKRIRFPNLQGKHLSLKFTSATDGSFAIYYLRHKMFKTRELCSDQKHPNTQGSHIGIKLSNSGSDEFILMYVSEKMQLVTT